MPSQQHLQQHLLLLAAGSSCIKRMGPAGLLLQ
jgi:hypothetical protein